MYVAAKPVHAVASWGRTGSGRRRKTWSTQVGPRGSVSGQFDHLLPAASVCDTEAMKPLRCLLHLHAWHNFHNDEGQRYQVCTRCGAYREIYILTDYGAGGANLP